MTQKYDVIIVGAGPVGSLYSLLTAQAGLKTLLLDRSHFPRPKVCLGYIHPDTWEIWDKVRLSSSLDQLEHYKVHTTNISSEKGKPATWEYKNLKNKPWALSRSLFDDWLRNEAIQAGVEALTGVEIQSFSNQTTLQTNQGTFESELVVGADGRRSEVARQANPKKLFPPARRIGWQTVLPINTVEHALRIHFFESGYWMTVPISQKQAHLCFVLTAQATQTPQFLINRFFDNLPALIWRSSSPLYRVPCSSNGRMILLGDAARVIEPLVTDNFVFSLHSATVGAEKTIQAFHNNSLDTLATKMNQSLNTLYRTFRFRNLLCRKLGMNPLRAMRLLNILSMNQKWIENSYRYLANN
ncbi:MAG: NAD(P)/FAD-dependent oxidoreductase [Verrucomicrobiota bacterium]